jgi:hypothetical protein
LEVADQGPVRQNTKTLYDLFLEERRKEKEMMMLEHQEALNDAERRVQEAEQRVYRLETTSPVTVQECSGDVECIARAVSIQSSTLGNSHSRSGLESNDLKDCYSHQGQISGSQISGGKRKLRLKRQKTKLPLLEIAEHET